MLPIDLPWERLLHLLIPSDYRSAAVRYYCIFILICMCKRGRDWCLLFIGHYSRLGVCCSFWRYFSAVKVFVVVDVNVKTLVRTVVFPVHTGSHITVTYVPRYFIFTKRYSGKLLWFEIALSRS